MMLGLLFYIKQDIVMSRGLLHPVMIQERTHVAAE